MNLVDIASDLLLINKDLRFRLKNSRNIDDFELYDFTQVWGSTALGFGGIGGQAMTAARTYVFVPASCDENCFVYFGSKYAYDVPYSNEIMIDISKQNIESVYRKGKYLIQNEILMGV